MKTMSCRQLGGACDEKFHGETFEEIAEQSKRHGIKMFHHNDPKHLAAMAKMTELMAEPEQMQKWFDEKRREFESLPDDE